MPSIHHGLILANDIAVQDEAIRISKLVAPYIDGVKLGISSIFEKGVSQIREIRKLTGKIIVADFKVADIGFRNREKNSWEGTNAKIVEGTIDAGADYIICHSIVGTSSIQESIEVAHSRKGKILTIPHMTHEGADLFFGHPLSMQHITKVFESVGMKSIESKLLTCKTISDAILVLGDYLGVDGFIGPANRPDILKRYRELTDKEIFGPGIGRQAIGGLSPRSQLRDFFAVCGERSAAIIGSAIYTAPDPVESAKQFVSWREETVGKK